MALLCKSIGAYVAVAWNKNVISLDGRLRARLHFCCVVWWITWKLNRSHRTANSIPENIWRNGKFPRMAKARIRVQQCCKWVFGLAPQNRNTVRSHFAYGAPMTPPTSNRYPSLFKMKIKMKTRSQQRAQWKHTQEKRRKEKWKTNEWRMNKK